MSPALHAQIIRTTWTKRSRGAPAATARARVPLALPLGVAALQRGQLSIAVYNFDEPDFAHPKSCRSEVLDSSDRAVFLGAGFSYNDR